MNEEVLKLLSESVKSLYDINGIEIKFNKFELRKIDNHNKLSREYRIEAYIDNNKISISGKKVRYLCSCGRENTILLKKFVGKTRLRCQHCSEDEVKKRNHSLFFKNGFQERITKKIINNTYVFDDESDEFKSRFFKKHLYNDEFEEFIKNVVSINGVDINKNDEIKYIYDYPTHNQYKYFPHVLINGNIVPFKQVYIRCPNCGKIHRISDSRSKREKIESNFYCIDCLFTNEKFKIRKYITVFGNMITYQSNLELSFIRKCEENMINIENGPEIKYYWNNSDRTYFSDFYLPKKRYIIEIKDNHKWHKEQIESGKWQAKENAAKEYAKNNNVLYKILFPQNIDSFFAMNEIV